MIIILCDHSILSGGFPPFEVLILTLGYEGWF